MAAIEVLGNPPTGRRLCGLGDTLEDFPSTVHGESIRTQEQVQAAVHAIQTDEKGPAMVREAEAKMELLRPFHRQHKIKLAQRDSWAVAVARLQVDSWSEVLTEARSNLVTARQAHAQHPGRASRVHALRLAETAFLEMSAGLGDARGKHQMVLASDEGRSQRVLQKAGVVIAGLATHGLEEAVLALWAAEEAREEAVRVLTQVCQVPQMAPAANSEDVDVDVSNDPWFFYKVNAKKGRTILKEREGEPFRALAVAIAPRHCAHAAHPVCARCAPRRRWIAVTKGYGRGSPLGCLPLPAVCLQSYSRGISLGCLPLPTVCLQIWCACSSKSSATRRATRRALRWACRPSRRRTSSFVR